MKDRSVPRGYGNPSPTRTHLTTGVAALNTICVVSKHRPRGTNMQERSFPIRVVAVFLVMVMMPPMWLLGATPGPVLPDPGRTGMTKEQQEQLGLQAMGEVYK